MNRPIANAFTAILFLSIVFAVYSQSPEGRLPVKIVDNRTQNALPSAKVCIGEFEQCLGADSVGGVHFENIKPGLYSLISWAEGYDTLVMPNIQVTSGQNNIVNLELVKQSSISQLNKLVVVGRKLGEKNFEQTNSVTRINNFELSNTAGTGNDINRVLAVQPSVICGLGDGFDNNLYVRGGRSRENVYLVDGIPFENASHFSSVDNSGGAVGFLNSTLVQSLDFYTGGFPARMPSRLSSVIDVNLRTGSFMQRKQQIDLNMSGLGLTTEGPMLNSRGSYLASVRLVDFRFLESMLNVDGLPSYSDFQLKTVFAPNANQTIKLVGIGAFDHFDGYPDIWTFGPTTQAEFKYDMFLKQGGGGISWDISSDKMRNIIGLTGTARYEEYHDDLTKRVQPIEIDTFMFNITQYNKNKISADSVIDPGDTLYVEMGSCKKRIQGTNDQRWQIGLVDDFSFYIGDDDQLSAGLFADYQNFEIQNESGLEREWFFITTPDGTTPTLIPGSYQSYPSFSVDSSLAVKHGGAYLEYIFRRGMFKVVTGVRGDYYTVITDYGISPRLGMTLKTNSLGTFSLSGGLFYQFPSDFSGLLGEIIASDPKWSTDAPLDKAVLQRSWQAVLGYERTVGKFNLLTVEAYLKWYDREYPFITPGQRKYGTNENYKWVWNLDDPDGEKRAYGLEVSYQKKKYDIFYYSLNYSLFRVENKYTDNKWYNDEYSLRNAAGISVGSNFFEHHGISLRLQLSEGKPYTPAVFDVSTNRWGFDSTKGFFSARLDPIVSMNLRYSFKFFRKWGNIMGYIEVWNVLNNLNSTSILSTRIRRSQSLS